MPRRPPPVRLLPAGTLVLLLAVGLACGLGSGDRQPGAQPSGAEAANRNARTAIADVERYWSTTFPQLSGGQAFSPVSGGYHPYTRAQPPPACGGEAPQYQPNAFYCPDGDFVAWDAEQLIPRLNSDFGPLLVGVVFAHEYGHAIQQRLGLTRQPTIVLEQQADCFAGGWVRDVDAGNAQGFPRPEPRQLDDTLAGILLLRDQPGTSAVNEGAHGNAFDRIRAFQDGFEQGPARCAGYRVDNLPVTEVPFTTRAEAANGGDLPYDEAVTALGKDVEAYWERTFPQLAGRSWDPLRVVPYDPAKAPACDGRKKSTKDATGTAYYCAADRFVAFDNRELGPTLYRNIGDNAVGMLLGDLFAQAAQDRRGQPTDGRAGQLAVDCLAGSWTYDLLHRGDNADIRLSPGDLDEAVAALLAFGRSGAGTEATGFDRIGAYRDGVLGGLGACH